MEITNTLFGKTFLILGVQLLVTWTSTILLLKLFTKLYHNKTQGLSATTTDHGYLDIHLSWDITKYYFFPLIIIDLILFLILIFWGSTNLTIGIPVFTLWSIVTGLELAFVLIAVDENLGSRVLALTTSITFGCALIGIYSGVDFSFMGQGLLLALMALLAANIFRIIVDIGRLQQRITAFFGVLVFIGYLLFDFNRLSQAAEVAEINTWPMAMDIAIELYLDIINLFLELLDLLSE